MPLCRQLAPFEAQIVEILTDNDVCSFEEYADIYHE